ncbi:Rubber cis-polyprenylcistransferase [Bertholletia excelsa]
MDADKEIPTNRTYRLIGTLFNFLLKCIFRLLSFGPIPQHIAFILDGNRRYARKWSLEEGAGHRFGFLSLMSMLKYCYELGIKYITIYAFSIDNLKRKPHEVQYVMDLMQEKIEGLLQEQKVLNRHGIRVYFVGDLKYLTEPVRSAAFRVMEATAGNSRFMIAVCVGYTSTYEIAHAVKVSCEEKRDSLKGINGSTEGSKGEEKMALKPGEEALSLADVESRMYMGMMPDVNILVRTSGETRLSNFLLYQTSNCLLYSPSALWPEIGLRHLVWATLNFQRHSVYLGKIKRALQSSQTKKEQ